MRYWNSNRELLITRGLAPLKDLNYTAESMVMQLKAQAHSDARI